MKVRGCGAARSTSGQYLSDVVPVLSHSTRGLRIANSKTRSANIFCRSAARMIDDGPLVAPLRTPGAADAPQRLGVSLSTQHSSRLAFAAATAGTRVMLD